jgi:hypothetical protein
MELQTWVNISQIVAAATLVCGTVFGLLQLYEYRQQRREAVALDLLSKFMGPEFSAAMIAITSLPEEVTVESIRQAGPEFERAANIMCTNFEAMGIMVHRRIAPFPLVMDMIGGLVVVVWRRLRPWIEAVRVETHNPSDSEWFQWLAEQCERNASKKEPAHIQHRGWNP